MAKNEKPTKAKSALKRKSAEQGPSAPLPKPEAMRAPPRSKKAKQNPTPPNANALTHDLGRIPDKRPTRAPRRPAAARFEPGRRTGSKKRLGN